MSINITIPSFPRVYPRLLLFVFMIFFAGFLLGVSLVAKIKRNHEIIQIHEAEERLLRVVRVASSEYSRNNEGGRQFLATLARLSEVKGQNGDVCTTLFLDLLREYPMYENLGAATENGDVYCSAPSLRSPSNLTGRSYFQRTVQKLDFTVGDYQITRGVDSPAINLAYPIRDDQNKFRGIVFATLRLSWFNDVATSTDLSTRSRVFLVNSNGVIVAHAPDPEQWIGEDGTKDPLIQNALKAGNEGTAMGKNPEGVEYMYAFTKLTSAFSSGDLLFVVGAPREALVADYGLFKNVRPFVILGVAFTLFIVVLGWFIGETWVLKKDVRV